MLKAGFLYLLWHLAITVPLAPYTDPDQAFQSHIAFLNILLWLRHNRSGQQKSTRSIWEGKYKDLWETKRGTRQNQGKSKRRRRRTQCVSTWWWNDVQISPEPFGTMLNISRIQPTDPWLKPLHMWSPTRCLNCSLYQAVEEKEEDYTFTCQIWLQNMRSEIFIRMSVLESNQRVIYESAIKLRIALVSYIFWRAFG